MKRIEQLERWAERLGGKGALARLSDGELLAALERLRRREPSGIDWTKGTPPDPTLAALSEVEIEQRLATATARMRPPGTGRFE